jgi:hypothetical protein
MDEATGSSQTDGNGESTLSWDEEDAAQIKRQMEGIERQLASLRRLTLYAAGAQGLLPFPIGATVVPAGESVNLPEVRLNNDLFRVVFQAEIRQAQTILTVLDFSDDFTEFRSEYGWCKTADWKLELP